MRVHCLQHVPFEGLGRMEGIFAAKGCSVAGSPLYASPQLPGLGDFDALVAMGGPMSVNDEADYPWLAAEKALVREAVGAGKIVLGVCLGAQLIASSLGARVYRNAEREIGWFPIEGLAAPGSGLFAFPPEQGVFHWHGETFDLPAGATRLARSAGCANQAFQIGRRTIGLQFHLETSPESARLLVENCRSELTGGRYVQAEAELLADAPSGCAGMAGELERLVDYLFEGA
jgi:GMP synthase-like glutamine amidotransferase